MEDEKATIIRWLGPQESRQWDEFVRGHPHGLIYHLSGWKEALESSFSHIRGHVLVGIDPETDQIEAGLPVYIVRSWLLGNRLVSVPFAQFCDPLLSAHVGVKSLLPPVLALGRRYGARQVELKIWRAAIPDQVSGFKKDFAYFHHSIPLDKEPEAIKKRFSKTCVRQWIDKASARGVRIEDGRSDTDLATFCGFFEGTRRRLCLPWMPRRFFEALRTAFPPGNLEFLIARHSGVALAGALILKHGPMYLLKYVGDTPRGRELGASQLLYWEAIKRACGEGFKIFSFGQTWLQSAGLAEYKRRWATTEERLGALVTARNDNQSPSRFEDGSYYRLGTTLMPWFPSSVYKVFSAFCYRHLGR